jgi:hypothetical protein
MHSPAASPKPSPIDKRLGIPAGLFILLQCKRFKIRQSLEWFGFAATSKQEAGAGSGQGCIMTSLVLFTALF